MYGLTQVESPICWARSQICTQYRLGVRFVRACHLALHPLPPHKKKPSTLKTFIEFNKGYFEKQNWLIHCIGFLVPPPPPPSFIFVPPSPSFKWVRLGVEARGPSVAAREGEKGTKMKGGGGGTINSIMGKSLKILPESRFYLRTKRIPEVDSVGRRVFATP